MKKRYMHADRKEQSMLLGERGQVTGLHRKRAQHLECHGELTTTPTLLARLDQISISMVGRIAAHLRQDQPRLPRKGPHRAHKLKDIPMLRLPWDEQQPSHF